MAALKPLEFPLGFLECARTVRKVPTNVWIPVEKEKSVEVTGFQSPKYHARGFKDDHGRCLVPTPNDQGNRRAAPKVAK